MGHIETGVDRLVRLISDKKKVSIDSAAKELGVSKLVVTEWAEFLEDEELITVDYSLSRTYLKEKELSKKDVEKKAKEYSTRKETFVRKVDTALQRIEQEGKGLESVKEEFDGLKDALGSELKDVQEELQELKKYETMRKNIDKDIEKEIKKYRDEVGQASAALTHEEKRFQDILGKIAEKETILNRKQMDLGSLEKLEERFKKKSEELAQLLDDGREELKSRKHDVINTEKHIDKLKDEAKDLREELQNIRTKKLDTLEAERDEHEKSIEDLKTRIMAKASEAKKAVDQDVAAGNKAVKNFEKFFERRLGAEKLIDAVQEEKLAIEKDMEALKKAALSFKIASKTDVNTHIKALEAKYNTLDKRHSSLRKKLDSLVNNIMN